MAYVLATGKLWFKVPETIRFCLTGTFPPLVSSKDLLLSIAGAYSAEVAQYRSVEFTGPLAKDLSLAGRMTMSNMAVEIGAKFGFFVPDQKVVDFLEGRTTTPYELIAQDADACYEKTYEIDVSSLEPQVAFPYSVDNVHPVSEAGDIRIHQAFIGSCTNGRLEDLHIAAALLKGKQVHPDVRLYVAPASWEVYRQAMNDGTLETLIDAGAVIEGSSCGLCFGAHQGLLASGENCIAAINRNFKGRMGSHKAQVFLASPATVAASAAEGRIADPRGYAVKGEQGIC
jgi:homoaconitase/3-isopropylmalate dehydratase large subunit